MLETGLLGDHRPFPFPLNVERKSHWQYCLIFVPNHALAGTPMNFRFLDNLKPLPYFQFLHISSRYHIIISSRYIIEYISIQAITNGFDAIMIEECKDILECEKRLSSVTPRINLLGEIPLSTQEVDKLISFIKEQFSDNIHLGIESVKTKAPTCFAFFLVWKGILDYRDGDYWSGFEEFSGLLDPNQQAKWGKFFISFLKANRLSSFNNIEDAHRYVTPILMHGMIPNSCLDEYFEEILLNMIKRELADPNDCKEINFLLNSRREEDKERQGIEKEIGNLNEEKKLVSNNLKRKRSIVKIWDVLDKIKDLEQKVGNADELVFFPKNLLEYKNKKNQIIQKLQKEIEKFASEIKECEQQQKTFSTIDKKALANTDDINQCIDSLPGLEKENGRLAELQIREDKFSDQIKKDAESLFFDPWDDKYISIIHELSLDALQDKIEVFNSRRAKELIVETGFLPNLLMIIKRWLNDLFTHSMKMEKTSQEIQVEISEILKNIPVKNEMIERPNAELVHSLKQICGNYKTICNLCETRRSKKKEINGQIIRIEKAARILELDITDNIRSIVASMKTKIADAQRNENTANHAKQIIEKAGNEIRGLTVEKQSIVKELQEVDECLIFLGNGNIQSGIEQLKERRAAQLKAESLQNDLMKEYPDLWRLKQERHAAQREGKGKSDFSLEIEGLDLTIKQIKQKIAKSKVKLEQIPEPYPYVDKPIGRFLLYAGDIATGFLIQSIQMLNRSITKQSVPSADEIGLPERVVTRFEKWCKEYCKISEGDDGIGSPEGLGRFRSPLIYFDPALCEIKIHFPSQRFPEKITGTCLIINEDKPDSHERQLRVFRFNKDLLETEKLDFPLPFPSTDYEFALKSYSQNIRSWNIQGISPNHPFMAFNYTPKKLIKEAELPKEKMWILFHNKFDLKPSPIIIEEAPLYGKWKEYKYQALDLSDVKHLYLVDQQGKKKPIPISSEKIFESRLFGGQTLTGCYSEERDIYIGEPPNICIPIENDEEIKRWVILIPQNSDCTLVESKHYRLSDLEGISIIDRDEGLIKTSLSDEKCIGNNPVGRFTVQLRNDVRHIGKRLSFCVVPHLKLEFDKDIYLPCEEDAPQVCLTMDGPEKMEFETQSSVKIIDRKDGSYRLKTTSSEHSMHGILRFTSSKGDLVPVPITIEIPRLTWRLDGMPNNEYSSESNRIEEIWFGDLENVEESLSLIVSMPSFINGQVRLSLRGTDQVSETKILEGKVRFDLLGFSDTLRADDEPLHTFELTVPDSHPSIDNVELFSVRTKWEIENIECIQTFYNDMLTLKISWEKEKGKPTGERIVRLWSIGSPDSDPVTQEITEGLYRTEIAEEQDKIPPGKYRVHIDIKDENSWSSSKPIMPPEDFLNILDIDIQEEVLHAKINITEVIDTKTDRMYKIEGKYIIQTEGKIVSGKLPDAVHDDNGVLVKKETNNGWYLGEISVVRRPPFVTGIDAVNPVKFEYISTKHFIEAIEDRDGDGVYFCTLCKELFWSQECYMQEKKKGHIKNILSEHFKIKFKLIT